MKRLLQHATLGAVTALCLATPALLVVLLMVTYVPWLSLWLPRMMGL